MYTIKVNFGNGRGEIGYPSVNWSWNRNSQCLDIVSEGISNAIHLASSDTAFVLNAAGQPVATYTHLDKSP
ncbi:hypothetical protein SK355_13275 [Candidatus Fukatsuia symbiotica]|uniref:Uncharacterized protein n=1 Tax=Candidatus Fukatsuia symbiotica TaxID=1878942 RepID=A0A2U8I4M4_9GAMM|nr:hypothetical protein [Candidatus Fukatsuia symbiotica]AWK14101.1 hypothetical protein CCS41_05800 [Candidatus Fukatsuia symbiotica]MEA9446130.1 hypothetical protein [Candidatus Fukatsuia symbiotica]